MHIIYKIYVVYILKIFVLKTMLLFYYFDSCYKCSALPVKINWINTYRYRYVSYEMDYIIIKCLQDLDLKFNKMVKSEILIIHS